MKNKVALLTMFIILFNFSFSYSDNIDNNVNINQVYTNLQSEFDYNPKTDTYYFPVNDISKIGNENTKSGAVAVSGAVISSILALAVKSGIEFATSDSMSEFVSRFFMLDGISSVVTGVSDVVSKSVNGVLDFSRSLLDTVGSKFSELMSKSLVSSVYIYGRRIPVINNYYVQGGSTTARYVFESTTLPKIKADLSTVTATDSSGRDVFDSNIKLPTDEGIGTFSVEFYRRRNTTPYYDRARSNLKLSDGSYYRSSYTIDFSSSTFSRPNFMSYTIPYLLVDGSLYRVGFMTAIYSTVTGYLDTIQYGNTGLDIEKSHVGTSVKLPTVSSSWTGSIPGDSDNSGVSISVPKDTNSLVGKTPSDVSTPTYELWTPGATVVPPTVDTGTDSPPVDDIYPPIADTPSVDNPPSTDTPSSGWDWLKALLNTLLSLIQSIVDWISSFWDRFIDVLGSLLSFEWLGDLLSSMLEFIKSIAEWITGFWETLFEFIKSIFVPSDGYFIGKFEDILTSLKSRIPGIDIDKLKSLAVGEYQFKDIYATFFGVKCLVVRGSIINDVVSWSRPIIQGLIAIFLLIYNYNQIYKLIRGGSVVGSTCPNSERG